MALPAGQSIPAAAYASGVERLGTEQLLGEGLETVAVVGEQAHRPVVSVADDALDLLVGAPVEVEAPRLSIPITASVRRIGIPPARRISSGFAHRSTLVAREATVLAASAPAFTIGAVGAALPPAIA
jgi:hypothetical protein